MKFCIMNIGSLVLFFSIFIEVECCPVSLYTKKFYENKTFNINRINIFPQSTKSDSSQIDCVNTILDLSKYSGNAKSVFVKDNLQGGIFNYVNNAYVDNGIVFEALGKKGGMWKRQYSQSQGVNVCWFGAKSDSSIKNNDKFINLALTSPNSNGTVYIPSGKYIINSTIKLKSNHKIYGDSRQNTILFLDGASNCNMIQTASFSEVNCEIAHLKLDGNYTNQRKSNGIVMATSGVDPYHRIDDIEIDNVLDTALSLWGRGGNIYTNIVIKIAAINKGVALFINTVDSYYSNIDIGHSDIGVYISSSNNLISNIKSWGCNTGFYLNNAAREVLTGLQAQDCRDYGFHLKGCYELNFNGLLVDEWGYNWKLNLPQSYSTAVYIDSSNTRNVFNGILTDRLEYYGHKGTGSYGLTINSTSHHNSFNFIVHNALISALNLEGKLDMSNIIQMSGQLKNGKYIESTNLSNLLTN